MNLTKKAIALIGAGFLLSGCGIDVPQTDNSANVLAYEGKTIYYLLSTPTDGGDIAVEDTTLDNTEDIATADALTERLSNIVGEDDVDENTTITQSAFSYITHPQHGTSTLDGTTLSYTPDYGYTGDDTIKVAYGDSDIEGYQTLTLHIDVTNINYTPIIEGIPTTVVTEGDKYSFTPTATDEDNNTLTFKIANKPVWCDFNSSTGELNGTASLEGGEREDEDDDGNKIGNSLFSDVTISVTDGIESVSLEPFDITVIEK